LYRRTILRDVLGEIMLHPVKTGHSVMRAALRLLEEREARMSALRAALIEGEESGPSTPFDFEAFIARKRMQKPKTR
ncbi:MAG: antitoxin ParD1/3/4, partial [Gammaproteobacteria bacterium]|nr:antitoxin ParD1/3/4 [Gammaproteobacteria bacterium]